MSKILGVVASLREQSKTRKLVQIILNHAEEFEGEGRLVDLRELPLPMYDPDAEDSGPVYDGIREQVLWADAFILGTPDYHGSMSGPMKNFLDYFWQEFMGKLFGYVVASHEKGLTVQDQMRTAVRQCYGWSLPYGIGLDGSEDFNAAGNLTNQRLALRTRIMARDLVTYGDLLYGQFRSDIGQQPRPDSFARFFRD